MRPITGTDIIDFYTGRDDFLVLTTDGEFTTIDADDVASSSHEDNRATAYDYATVEDGDEVQVLLERTTIDEGEWFPDALDEDGALIPSVADEMADIINHDGILHSRVLGARRAGDEWKDAAAEADRKADTRAHMVATVVAFCGNNQSEAARQLGLDQSTVNKLVKKARALR